MADSIKLTGQRCRGGPGGGLAPRFAQHRRAAAAVVSHQHRARDPLGLLRPTRVRRLERRHPTATSLGSPLSAAVADSLGIDRFATMGHSSGGGYALACAALLPQRVSPSSASRPWPRTTPRTVSTGSRASPSRCRVVPGRRHGRAALEAHEAAADEEQDMGFTDADEAALGGEWSWFLDVVRPALESGPAPMMDDTLAAVRPWGFDVTQVAAPTLVVHGGRDRVVPSSHGEWLARQLPAAQLWLRPDDGHITVMDAGADALRWLAEHA